MQLQLIGSIFSFNVAVAIASVAVSCRIGKALGAKASQLGPRPGGSVGFEYLGGINGGTEHR